ncbi:uncharacterized protein K452DRAFT_8754 [Aplosporella prunicola CBS 121167]|uniref:Uncharacterized protein n=1 Tax=Aplosporella prunicola CBS 121167 TaxID=1176127 RepID=A0A6A6BTS9_9PEZI|nr:uncharacterized protein K452DRAFT_8754 [Aplosporella prunicola CBS 121167]KAF2147539.1 hypothetical protein K452DRAFT_8754 [Aplosporella prunicola CBS 121167]
MTSFSCLAGCALPPKYKRCSPVLVPRSFAPLELQWRFFGRILTGAFREGCLSRRLVLRGMLSYDEKLRTQLLTSHLHTRLVSILWTRVFSLHPVRIENRMLRAYIKYNALRSDVVDGKTMPQPDARAISIQAACGALAEHARQGTMSRVEVCTIN